MQPEQKQEYQERPCLSGRPLLKKILCPVHGNKYFYKCLHARCDKYICGKIECIDEHFHDNQLKIAKIDINEIINKLQHLERIDIFINKTAPVLEHYRISINSMKETSSQIFSLYKRQKQVIFYLQNNEHQRLDKDYFSELSNLKQINESLQGEINGISSRINWKNIWTTIGSEFNIIQKLKLDFKEFRSLYLESKKLNIEELDRRWEYVDNQYEPNQGILIVYFTKENFIIGEYISNANVQTGCLFLDSFIFIIDPEGKIYKDRISENILEYKDNFYSPHFEPDLLFHLNLKINSQTNSYHNKTMQMELKVIRVESFECTK